MRGSIRKRGSTYSYWLDIGSDPVTGKRRQRTKGGFRTKRECQAALNEAISALRSGTLVQPSRRTVASFLAEEWLPAVRMAGLRDSTWASYRMNVEKHLVPGLGAIELQRLSPAQLNAFYRCC
jgi:integrase